MAKAKILIVEDESIVALDLENRLRNFGYSVPGVAASGEEAIQKAAETRPDMVLMDIRLKGDMDGIKAAQEIRARFDVPVVYLTALADDDALRQAKITEPFGYILKPFEDGELRKTIEIALHKHVMERKLRESEQWLATTLRSISDAVIAVDKKGFVTFMNPTAEALTGWMQDAALGRDWRAVFSIVDEQKGTPDSSLARALEEGVAVGPADHVLVAKDGAETFIHDSTAPIKDEKGDIIGFVLAFRDITERKRAEQALRRARDELERRVEERTAELSEANALLGQEIAERKQAEETLRRYAKEQAALYAVTSAVVTLLGPDELLFTVLGTVLPVLESDAGWVTLPGPTADHSLRVAAWSGVPESFVAAEEAIPRHACPIYAPLLAGGEAQIEPRIVAECPCLPHEVLVSADVRSHIGIPLTAGNKVLGILNVAWRESRLYTESDRALLMAIGQQVGLALHNAQLYQAARQVDRLRVLNELDRALAATLEPDTVVEVALRQIAAAVDAPMGALFALPPQTDVHPDRVFTLGWGWVKVAASEKDVQRLSAVLERLRDTRAPVLLSQDGFTALVGGEHRDLTGRWGPRGLVIPVRDDGELVAVLALGGRPADRPFTDEDRALAQAAAGRASQSIRNARLYAAEQEQRTLAESLRDIAAALNSTLDFDEVLDRILANVGRMAPHDAANIMLIESGVARIVRNRGYAERGVEEAMLALRFPVADTPHLRQMVETGQPLVIPDAQSYPDWVDYPETRWIRSYASAPILLEKGGKTIGFLNLDSATPDVFIPIHAEHLQAFTDQAAAAIQNARLYQASEEQSARLMTLNAISAAAVSSLELDTVLHHVLDLTCQALDAAEGSILLREPHAGGMFFAVTLTDARSALRGQHIAPGQGIAGWVAQHGQPVCVNDVRRDPRWYEGVDAITGFETRSLCCAPLRHRGKVTGVIDIVNKKTKEEGDAFTAGDLSLLEAVSSIAAAALDNTRLYTATQARADELALLNEIGLALTSTLDFSTVIHAALNQVQRLFQAENVSLLQPDLQTGELCFVRALVGGTLVEVPVRLQPGEGVAGWALKHRQPVLVEDAQTDPRFSGRVDQHLGNQTRALMAVPLLTTERAIGVIEVISGERDAFTRSELNTLQALASTLSVALENTRLYEDLKTLLRQREQAQAQLIHSEKVAALGRLAASIAHEINNPLQAVQGCLTLAKEEQDGRQRREKMDRYLNVAGSEIERIAVIVRRMRDFYRPAREGLQPTDLCGVLESVLELTNKQLQHSDITVEREWAGELPVIQANPDHLKQVFLNLVINAIDAMPGGGTLRISTALEKPGFSEKTRFLRIEFSDTGEGMPAEVLSHLFEPFFTTKEHGSGLGLSISYAIIQSHGGGITATSQVGAGTTFTILLPVERT